MELDLDDSMVIKKKYIYAHGQVLAQHDIDGEQDDLYFYLHDRLGSVRLVIEDGGDVVKDYTYEPFGEVIDSGGSFEDPFRFTGQYYDAEIAEYHLRARQYNPYISRFTSRDPVFGKFEEPLTLHKYLYCGNDPINMIDPTGKFLSGALLVEPIMAGYSVHYGALGFAAYGVATGNERFLTLGIELQKMVLPVMAIAMVARWNPIEKMGYDLDQQHGNNWFGSFKSDPRGRFPKYVAIALTGVAIAHILKGCPRDPLEQLPSEEDWDTLLRGDDVERFERPPDDT